MLILTTAVWLLCGITCCIAEEADSRESTEKSKWLFLGAPYVFANSDFGIIIGIGGGLSKYPEAYFQGGFNYGTSGYISTGISYGEVRFSDWKTLGSFSYSKTTSYIYTLEDSDPVELAEAEVSTFETQLSLLRLCGSFEFGPAVLFKMTGADNPIDTDENPLPEGFYPRFGEAKILLLGPRVRYITTNIIRPLKGVIIEAALRGGISEEEDKEAIFDADAEVKFAVAQPLSERSRLYLRLWGIAQKEAPEPVQNHLGGEKTLRGQPFMREWGRRFFSGRLQYHLTVISQSPFPMNIAHKVIHFIPANKLDFELVPFYDVGFVGDSRWGWNKTRHCPGIGIHIVLPPQLVFRIDFAIAPGGALRYYFGAGETI